MVLAPPSSLRELIADGAIAQATIDDYFRFRFSLDRPVEFTRHPEQAEVRLTDTTGQCHSVTGTIIAQRFEEGWAWSPQWLSRTDTFGIPEFHPHQPVTAESLTAARTLCGNGTLLRAPDYALILPPDNPWHSERESLLVGLPQIPSGVDKQRAILAHSVLWNSQPLSLTDNSARLVDGTQLGFADCAITSLNGDLSLSDVLSDAWFISSEYDLFLNSFLPSSTLSQAENANTYLLTSAQGRTLRCTGEVIGTLTQSAFYWGWITPGNTSEQSRQLSYIVRNFAVQHGIPELLSPIIGRDTWDNMHILRAVQRITNRWVCLPCELENGSAHLIALENPAFRLPDVTPDCVTAVRHVPTPPYIDVQRAWTSYKHYRGLSGEESFLV